MLRHRSAYHSFAGGSERETPPRGSRIRLVFHPLEFEAAWLERHQPLSHEPLRAINAPAMASSARQPPVTGHPVGVTTQ